MKRSSVRKVLQKGMPASMQLCADKTRCHCCWANSKAATLADSLQSVCPGFQLPQKAWRKLIFTPDLG